MPRANKQNEKLIYAWPPVLSNTELVNFCFATVGYFLAGPPPLSHLITFCSPPTKKWYHLWTTPNAKGRSPKTWFFSTDPPSSLIWHHLWMTPSSLYCAGNFLFLLLVTLVGHFLADSSSPFTFDHILAPPTKKWQHYGQPLLPRADKQNDGSLPLIPPSSVTWHHLWMTQSSLIRNSWTRQITRALLSK